MKKIIAAVIVLLIIGAYVYIKVTHRVAVKTAIASKGTMEVYITEDGKTSLSTKYTVLAEFTGKMERIPLEIGDTVAKGDLITTIEDVELAEAIKGANARIRAIEARFGTIVPAEIREKEIELAQTAVEKAKRSKESTESVIKTLEREIGDETEKVEAHRKLYEAGDEPEEIFDDRVRALANLKEELARKKLILAACNLDVRSAELALANARLAPVEEEPLMKAYAAEIEAIQAEIRTLENRLEKTVVKAPISGIVFERPRFDEGMVTAGAPLIVIGRVEDIQAEADFLSEDVAKMVADTPARITGETVDDRHIPAVVKRIHPSGFTKLSTLGVEQQRVTVEFSFDNSALKLRPGWTVEIEVLKGRSENAVLVPERSVFRMRGADYLFVVKNDVLELRAVKTGLRNRDFCEVVSGLSKGETVVADPDPGLDDGMKVKPDKE